MKKQLVKIERTQFKQVKDIVEIELPSETTYYFVTGIRKSYKVVPRFQNWEGGDGSIFKYDIIEVGLSFECTISKYTLSVTDLPQIYSNPKNKFYNLVNSMFDECDLRTEEQFKMDFRAAIEELNSI